MTRSKARLMSQPWIASLLRPAASMAAAAFVCCALAFMSQPAAAATAAGTLISNTASATYTDTNGVNYSTQSNTVVVEVQNAPSLTVFTNNGAAPGTGTGVPNSCFADVYTLTNTGNGLGHFQLPTISPPFAGSDAGSVTTTSYSLSINGGATTTGMTLAALNAALAAPGGLIPAGGNVVITINYCIGGAVVPGTIISTVQANIKYLAADQPNPGGLVDTTSANVTNTYTDTITGDARLDLQKTVSITGPAGAPVVNYTVKAANGGNAAARSLTSVQGIGSGAPFTTPGALVVADNIPLFAATTLTLNGVPAVATNIGNGFVAGAVATIVYSTDPTGATGWSTSAANAKWIGVYVTNGAAYSPVVNTNGTSAAGNVPNPAITLTFSVNGPTGPGSGNANAVCNIANSVVGGDANNANPSQLVGPTIVTLVNDGSAGAPTQINNAINNSTSLANPSGASQLVCVAMPASRAVLNGPRTAPGATGSYDGVVAVSNDNDFTDVGFVQPAFTVVNGGTVPGTPNGNNFSAAVSGINVSSDVMNSGNVDDTYTIVATAPAGFTVQLFQDNGANAPSATPLGGATAGATSTATGVVVASGVTLHYWAVYSAPSGTQSLKRYDGNTIATSAADATIHNETHHELYSSFVALTKSVVIVTNCAGAVPANGVCPGGTLTYTLDYRTIVTIPGAGNTEPAAAILTTSAGSVVVTEDGAAAPNNWATFTNGLNGAVIDSNAWGTVFTYTPGPGPATATKFTAQLGGASGVLSPTGTAQGTLTFALTVK